MVRRCWNIIQIAGASQGEHAERSIGPPSQKPAAGEPYDNLSLERSSGPRYTAAG